MTTRHAAVLVVGGGPAGPTAAAALAPPLGGDVVVLEREVAAGGIPRHSDHLGYGVRDLHRFISGPEYARRLAARAADAGADVRTSSMVTGWDGSRVAEVTSPQGRYRVSADAVILATGARERPRAARLVPGTRPAGVYTTGQLQHAVHLNHAVPGERAVVVGAELVSWSAVLTLRTAGTRTVLMTSTHTRPESYAAFNLLGRAALRVPVSTRTRAVGVLGTPRVAGIEVEDLRTGRRRVVACDTIIFTGDWIPDHELARSAGLAIDEATSGPLVDARLRTSGPGVFAIGNLVHPVDTADVAALDGRHVIAAVLSYLRGEREPPNGVRLRAAAPLRWVTPGRWNGREQPARHRLLAWTDEHVRTPNVVVRQDDHILGHHKMPWPASPGRILRMPASLLSHVDPAGGDVTLSVE